MAPRTLDARFRLVTPTFISGAQDGADRPAELRVPSLLGVLRFWWRALEWRSVEAADDPLAELRKREDRLFGAAGKDKGQGLVLARLRERPELEQERAAERGGAFYLAGQGLKERTGLVAGTTFTLRFTVRPRREAPAQPDELASLRRAVCCLGLLGGVGSRSRHGYGSLVLLSITDSEGGLGWSRPADLDAYQTVLEALLAGPWPKDEPPYTAFSEAMRLTLIPAEVGLGIKTFMDQQGHQLQHFRGKGARRGKPLAGPYKVNHELAVPVAGHPFEADIRWFSAVLGGAPVTTAPERAIFGLPHNYRSQSMGRGVNVTAAIPKGATGNAFSDRRASPLFLHFHELLSGDLVAAWLFLPALFLPDVTARGPQLKVDDQPVDYRPSWRPIEMFYDQRLATQAGAVTVLP